MAVGTTNYPASLDTVVELVEAANNAADTLSAGISAGDTSLSLVDASEFAASGIVAIENELISYTGKAGSTLTGLTRGIEGTTAATHSSGADVRQVITAASHNVQSAAIIALETKLGTGTDIAWSKMAPLTANRLVVTDGAGDITVSPLTHDATNAIIGNVGGLDFDTTPTAGHAAARLIWDDADGTAALTLKGGNVTVPLSQRDTARVVNKSGSNLLASNYQVVRISTAQGQRLGINLAQANSEPNSTDILGLVSENISNNQEGFVTTRGLVTEIDTTGSLQGETWADGDILYLSPGTLGGLTKVEPQAPNHLVIVGYVVYAHQNHGKIFVAIQTSWETKELHDVKITGTPTAGSLLIRNATTGVWENATLTAGSNISITNADAGITIAATGSGDVVGPSSATDNALARFDTTTGKLIQNSLITLSDAGALSFPDGVRQTFNPNGTNAGINVGAHTSDPSSATNGDLWYNSTANQLKTRRGAVTEVVATIPSNLGDEIPILNATTGNLSATGEVFWDGSGNALQVGNTSTGALRLVNATGTDSFTLLPPASGGAVALTLPPGIGSIGQALTSDGTGGTSWSTITAGVSSVSGTSPVVSSGGSTPAISLASGYGDTQNPYASKTANHFLAAPNGTAGVPTFRAIVAADIPTLNQNTTGTASNVTGTVAIANGGTGLTSISTGQLLIGTSSGGFAASTLTAGSNVTITSGSGTVTIAAASGATPGGSDTQVQFNDGGSTLGGDAGFTYNKTTNTATLEQLNLGTAGSARGILRLRGNTSGEVTIQPASTAGTYTLTLPGDDGNANQVLATDGSGVLNWVSAGSLLTLSTQSPTTADITGASNTRYRLDISGLTATRSITIPSGTAGDVIEIYLSAGDDTYELIVKGAASVTINGGSAATEWSRLFITNEFVQLVCVATNTWIVTVDGRIPCQGIAKHESTSVGTISAVNATTDTLTVTAHGLNNGDSVRFTGTPPTGLLTNVIYWVRNKTTDTFQVGITSGAASAVDIAGTTTGAGVRKTQNFAINIFAAFDLNLTSLDVGNIVNLAGNGFNIRRTGVYSLAHGAQLYGVQEFPTAPKLLQGVWTTDTSVVSSPSTSLPSPMQVINNIYGTYEGQNPALSAAIVAQLTAGDRAIPVGRQGVATLSWFYNVFDPYATVIEIL